IHHETGTAECRYHRLQPANGLARSRRAYGRGMRVARRGDHDVERPRVEAQQSELCELDIECARLGLRQNGGGIALLYSTACEDLAKRVDPFALDPVRQHGQAIVSRRVERQSISYSSCCTGGRAHFHLRPAPAPPPPPIPSPTNGSTSS